MKNINFVYNGHGGYEIKEELEHNDIPIEVIQLEPGETVLTKEETSELSEVLCTEYISTDFPNAKEAVRKLLRNRK